MQDEELLAPSLQEHAPVRALRRGERPWRLGSQFYIAFFGGALAVTAIAWLNARRLGASRDTERWILILGALGVLVSIVASYLLYGGDFSSASRIGYRIVGVVLFGALYKLQQPADRVYAFRQPGEDDDQYDRLWGPGLAATFGGGLVQLLLVLAGIAALDAVFG